MKRIAVMIGGLLIGLALAAGPASAAQGGEGNNTGCNGQGNPNSPCVNNGGAGGAGGAGGSAAATATATAVSTAVSVSSASAHQRQDQQQGQYQGQSYQGEQTTNVHVSTDVPRQAPPAVPAALAVSSLTCYGSWSIAASTPFGGVGAGFPTKDADCERSRNALILVNLGLRDAALALLAQNEETAKALRVAKVSYPGQVAVTDAPVAAKVPAPAPAPTQISSRPEASPSLPTCGDGRPAALTASGFYSCATFRK